MDIVTFLAKISDFTVQVVSYITTLLQTDVGYALSYIAAPITNWIDDSNLTVDEFYNQFIKALSSMSFPSWLEWVRQFYLIDVWQLTLAIFGIIIVAHLLRLVWDSLPIL